MNLLQVHALGGCFEATHGVETKCRDSSNLSNQQTQQSHQAQNLCFSTHGPVQRIEPSESRSVTPHVAVCMSHTSHSKKHVQQTWLKDQLTTTTTVSFMKIQP